MWRASVVAWALFACGARVQHDPIPPGGSGSGSGGMNAGGGGVNADADDPMCFERAKLPSAWWGAEAKGGAGLASLPCPAALDDRFSSGVCVFALSRLDAVTSEAPQGACCYLGRILHCR